MGENTDIEWADHTLNWWWGCEPISPGCTGCYAEAWAKRTGRDFSARTMTTEATRFKALKWDADAETFRQQHGRRQRVFVNSLSDFFDNKVLDIWRVGLFDMTKSTPDIDYLILTKRIGNAVRMLPSDWGNGYPNVWLGATVVNREEMLRDTPKLKAIPARIHFWSVGPMLGDLGVIPRYLFPDWVICEGESGSKARPIHPDWARSLRDQCVSAGVPFHFKQWGEFSYGYDRDRDDPDFRRCAEMDRRPGRWVNLAGGHGFHGERVHYAEKVGKKKSGRLLDGRTWDQFPVNSVVDSTRT